MPKRLTETERDPAEDWLEEQTQNQRLTQAEKSRNASRNASIATNAKWAKTDRVAGTAKARRKWLESFEDQVDPDRTLPAAERARRAESAKRAYFTQLSAKAAKARQAKRIAKAAEQHDELGVVAS